MEGAEGKNSLGKSAKTSATAAAWGEHCQLSQIWNKQLNSRSSRMLVMSLAPEVFENGKNKSPYYLIWGLDEDNTWCKLEGWGNDAEKMQLCLAKLLPEGHGYVSFSALRHNQSFRGSLKNCMAFRVNPGCQYAACQGFGEDGTISLPPQPRINSDFSKFNGWSELHKCFITVKVHEIRESIPESPGTSERLLLSLLDMSGGLRKATVWPPLCSLDIWSEGSILTILGCTVSMQYQNVTIGSDTLAFPDPSFSLADFPEVIMSMIWTY